LSTNVFVPDEGFTAVHSGSDLEHSTIWDSVLWWVLASSLIDDPRLTVTVMAVPEGNVSVVNVGTTMDIKALEAVVSDVLVSASVPLDLLGVVTFVLTDGGSDSNVEALSLLVGNDEVLARPSSDGVGSSVEGPPLLLIVWVVVSDSKSELVTTDVLVPDEGSVAWHSRFDLELDARSQRLSWVGDSLPVNVPSVSKVLGALSPEGVSAMRVVVTMNSEALATNVLDVSSLVSVPGDLVEVLSGVLSDDSSVSIVGPPVGGLVWNGDSLGSVSGSSDGSGSPVENKPLLVITWVVVSDSKAVLIMTNMFTPEQSSVGLHSVSDLELLAISKRVLGEVNVLSADSPT
jgi:hypothetical protein